MKFLGFVVYLLHNVIPTVVLLYVYVDKVDVDVPSKMFCTVSQKYASIAR